jgi:hypothetical protein
MDRDGLDDHSAYRSMRWYEWLACLFLLLLACGARAATTYYRCIDGRGETAFQDQPCGPSQQALAVDVAPAPPYAPSPQYAVAAPSPHAGRGESPPGRRREPAEPAAHSFECRSTDGQVFYRHTACPHSIAAAKDDHFGRGGGAPKKVEVHAVRVSRDEACTQMRRAGAVGRSGHANDEVVSSYDKNLGRDPCR